MNDERKEIIIERSMVLVVQHAGDFLACELFLLKANHSKLMENIVLQCIAQVNRWLSRDTDNNSKMFNAG